MARVGEEFPLECPGCGGDIRLIAFITDPGPMEAQFTPGSRTTLRDLPPLTPDREYTPTRSAERHRPEDHRRNPSILSPAVTATGTTFCAA